MERPADRLIDAPVWREVNADRPGVVEAVDTRAIGLAVVALGGGRTRVADAIDPRVGFTRLAPIGAIVPDQPLGIVHAATDGQAEAAAYALRQAYAIGQSPPMPHPAVIERVTLGAAS